MCNEAKSKLHPRPKVSPRAAASLVCGIAGVVPDFGLPAALLAIALGHSARSQLRKGGGVVRGDQIAAAGLILRTIGLASFLALMILALRRGASLP